VDFVVEIVVDFVLDVVEVVVVVMGRGSRVYTFTLLTLQYLSFPLVSPPSQ